MKLIAQGIRTSVVAAGVLLLAAGSVSAQGEPGGDQSGVRPQPPSLSEIISSMKMELSLTDEQTAQVTTIFQEELAQIESLTKSGVTELVRSQIGDIDRQAQSQLAQVLTAEQLAKMKSIQSQEPPANGGESAFDGNGNSNGPAPDNADSGR